MFLSFVFTVSLLPPSHPGKGKKNTSYNDLMTQTDYAPSPVSCSSRQQGDLHRAQSEADFGHGKCRVRYRAL